MADSLSIIGCGEGGDIMKPIGKVTERFEGEEPLRELLFRLVLERLRQGGKL